MEIRLGTKLNGSCITSAGVGNPHMFVDGISGSGKSFALRHYAEQAARQGARVIILDYTRDWANYEAADRMDVVDDVTANPLAAVGGASAFTRAQRLTNILLSVYRLGSRATVALNGAARSYLEETAEMPDIEGLLRYIRGRPLTRGLDAVLEPLEVLAQFLTAGAEHINIDLGKPGLLVLDFKQVESVQMRKLLVELLLRVLWDKKAAEQEETSPLVLLLDECQGLYWGESGMAVRILREGRKFGIGGWFASQWVSDPVARTALRQAATQLHFRQDQNAAKRLARELAAMTPRGPEAYARTLRRLAVGEFTTQDTGGAVHVGRVNSSEMKRSAI